MLYVLVEDIEVLASQTDRQTEQTVPIVLCDSMECLQWFDIECITLHMSLHKKTLGTLSLQGGEHRPLGQSS